MVSCWMLVDISGIETGAIFGKFRFRYSESSENGLHVYLWRGATNFFSASLIYGVIIYRNAAKLWLFQFLTSTTVNRRFSR